MGACRCGGKVLDVVYDILTIVISIADVSTDIIVLVSFYEASRMTFFALSLVILIIAQIAYSLTFMVRYEVPNAVNYSNLRTMCVFFALLPFGSLISFFIYFTDDPESRLSKAVEKYTGLNVSNTIARNNESSKKRSPMVQWMIRKLSKHIGFIIEAGIEALPQSLLQITAIVYFGEANYVSIASIFLSMFSVMTKSLVFS